MTRGARRAARTTRRRSAPRSNGCWSPPSRRRRAGAFRDLNPRVSRGRRLSLVFRCAEIVPLTCPLADSCHARPCHLNDTSAEESRVCDPARPIHTGRAARRSQRATSIGTPIPRTACTSSARLATRARAKSASGSWLPVRPRCVMLAASCCRSTARSVSPAE